MKRNRVYVDYAKLEEQIKKVGFSKAHIARGIGYSDNIFSNAKDRGYFGEECAERLQRVYGIKRKLYEISEPMVKEVKVEVVDPPKADVFDWTQLYNTIYAATLAALKKNADDMKDRLFEGK